MPRLQFWHNHQSVFVSALKQLRDYHEFYSFLVTIAPGEPIFFFPAQAKFKLKIRGRFT